MIRSQEPAQKNNNSDTLARKKFGREMIDERYDGKTKEKIVEEYGRRLRNPRYVGIILPDNDGQLIDRKIKSESAQERVKLWIDEYTLKRADKRVAQKLAKIRRQLERVKLELPPPFVKFYTIFFEESCPIGHIPQDSKLIDEILALQGALEQFVFLIGILEIDSDSNNYSVMSEVRNNGKNVLMLPDE